MKMINGKDGFFLAQQKYKKKRHKSRHLVTEIGSRKIEADEISASRDREKSESLRVLTFLSLKIKKK